MTATITSHPLSCISKSNMSLLLTHSVCLPAWRENTYNTQSWHGNVMIYKSIIGTLHPPNLASRHSFIHGTYKHGSLEYSAHVRSNKGISICLRQLFTSKRASNMIIFKKLISFILLYVLIYSKHPLYNTI